MACPANGTRAGAGIDWGDMQARYEELSLDTQGHGEVIDVTASAQKAIDNAGIADGLCTVFVAHSTCGMTIIECEPGCNADLNTVLERIAPQGDRWEHNERNADTNGHSHARAALIGPSVTIPVAGGELLLGIWQKIVCVDFDDRPRTRRVVVQLLG
jgi:secondary thiamine-phosphate synthase enzyme